MIKKISKIKNLGIFNNYTWETNLSKFERYNLIYGWNASGKTTLTDLFTRLEIGVSEKYKDLDYKVNTDSGLFAPNNPFPGKIRVFNQEYIAKNIQLLYGKAKPIFVLGEENKKIADRIDADEIQVADQKKIMEGQRELRAKLEKERASKFTDIARIISANTSGEATRKYNKRNAEDAFKNLSKKIELSKKDIDKYILTVKQLERESAPVPSYPNYIINSKEYAVKNRLDSCLNKSKNLLSKTVELIVIERLRNNSDIYSWVEQGVRLHNKYNSKVCEFCGRKIPDNRTKQLLGFFNDADKQLKQDLDQLIVELKKCLESIVSLKLPDKAILYKELQKDYGEAKQNYEIEMQNFVRKLKEHIKTLGDKKLKTTEEILMTNTLSFTNLIAKLESAKDEINKHNNKTQNFANQKSKARTALENHYLSTVYDDIKSLDNQISDADKEINNIVNNPENGITALQAKIDNNYKKISSPHKACAAINQKLHTFLGKDELMFEPEDKAFLIKRKGKLANNLSEGEKTAIAFVYFTIHLKDKMFKLKDGIVVIDDPISSLDSNSLFQAFAFLKNSVSEAKQIFILTHNFDFLKLLLNWIKHVPKSAGKKSFYMINNKYTNDGNRYAYLTKMDDLLRSYESEYHYLFKILYDFKSDGTLASVYHIPNVARKVLDTFLMFRVPNSESYYKKIESLRDVFDENKLAAIYKFTNNQSHITGKGFDPALVPETQKCVTYLLEMIETVFKEHYKILKESINNAS